MKRPKFIHRFIYQGIILLVLLGFSMYGYGQEEKKKAGDDFAKEFDAFNKDIDDEFDAFRQRNDSIFKTFLEGAWKELDVFISEKKIKPKPEEQPVWDGEKRSDGEGEMGGDGEITPMREQEIEKEDEIPPKSSGPEGAENSPGEVVPTGLSINVDFFGSLIGIPIDLDAGPLGGNLIRDKHDIADFYELWSKNSQVSTILNIIAKTATERKLNGWGVLQLLEYVSDEFFADRQVRILFIWYGLLHCGVDARICLDGEKLILFVHTDSDLYNCNYITFNEKKYYVIDVLRDTKKLDKIATYDSDYPGDVARMKLKFTEPPVLTTKRYLRSVDWEEDTFDLIANIPLIDFYSTYPDCCLEVYFSAPLSKEALASWDKGLGDEFMKLSDIKKVNHLLHIIQYAFPYQLDERQFGKEKYMFAEEALFYPFTDCEDRSVLLVQLVKHYTDLPVIGLDFPEHIAIGVAFKDEITGDFVNFRDKKYYICDPTFIGAEVGVGMEVVKATNPMLILMD